MADANKGSIIFVSDYAALVGCDVHNYDECPEEMEKDFSLDFGYVKGSYVNYARQAAGFLGESGLHAWVRRATSYYRQFGMRFNAVCPGGLESDRTPPLFKQNYSNHTQLGRLANGNDI